MEFPKMDSFVSKVTSIQSKLQFQPCQKSKCNVKPMNLSFPSTSTVTSKDKNVTNSISENNVSSLCETLLNPSLNLSLAREKVSFSNSVTPAAQPSSFSSRDFFSGNVALLDSTSSATEPSSFSSNLSVISKPSDLENIASEENDESSIDFSKILGCKKDVSTLTKLKNLSNAEKLKLMRSVFVASKSYVFPVTVRHFNYDLLEQYPWLCYSPIEDGAYCLYCVLFASTSSSRGVQLVHIPYCKWPDAQDISKQMVFKKNQCKIMKAFLKELSGKQELVNMQVPTPTQKKCERNKNVLLSIIDIIKTIGRMGIALRGNEIPSRYWRAIWSWWTGQLSRTS